MSLLRNATSPTLYTGNGLVCYGRSVSLKNTFASILTTKGPKQNEPIKPLLPTIPA